MLLRTRLTIVVVLGAAALSCQKRRVAAPPLPPAVPASQGQSSAPPEQSPAAGQEPGAPAPAQAPAPPAPSRSGSISRPVGPAPAPQPAPAQPVIPAPQIGPLLTAEQQREYNGAIDRSIERAQTSLRSIANRQLTKEQQANVEETENFIRQAVATRRGDLAGARRLAERAEVLARNLERSLR